MSFVFKSKLFKAAISSICFLFFSVKGFGDQVYQQNVSFKNSKSLETHTWFISSKKFRLEIKSDQREVYYIFTGRSLMACLKGDLKSTAKGSGVPAKWFQAIQNGVCLVAPLNLMTHFLISPLHMQFFLQTNGSMSSQISIDSYRQVLRGESEIKKIKCQKIDREYKFSNLKSEQTFQVSGGEKGCFLESSWRKGLWREVSRRLLQQPKARSTRQKLSENKIQKLGLMLEGESSFKNKSGLTKIDIKLAKVEERKIPNGYFRKPSDFVMMNTYESKKGTMARISSPQVKKTKGSEEEEGVSVLFFLRMLIKPI